MKTNQILPEASLHIPEAVIGSAQQAVAAQSSQPVKLRLEPMLRLLMMLRRRHPRWGDVCWREASLPAGCVLAVRYRSR